MDTSHRPAARHHSNGDHLDVEALLFDLDGTLIDSTRATEKCWQEWSHRMGLGEHGPHPHGVPARDVVAQRIEPGRRAEALALIEALEVEQKEGIAIKDGVAELLAALPATRWAIVTSCTAELAAVRLSVAGIEAPAILVSADSVAQGKPDPEGYLAAATALGVDPQRTLVFEDAPAGIEAGRAAGAWTLGITGTYDADSLDASKIVGTLEGLTVAVGGDGTGLRIGFPTVD
ncbi:MAG: HAD-IA family hydrolase [Arthrobacter sp.]|uniref:HAD-IA family hydrolase n=1 Tax=unclassified Arthrobacter TaxID=235627 RepID=UPI00264BACE9|nr:HAD-IA family hydrolase [Micrococcaceae bacterium]MDN5813807.1 HAD-IA family hydrolase [Micrococcaceae bacterium]MDN5824249.1 HAD-IA family hydrolase [Micrococcaceae bacterium]MDN5879921.1 HAD-IA family hydrolase [Micrococcaceae bacterium]MDN5887337.1 HAD-IA family hydrolase [Micrococcaceae bacterium]